MNKIFLFIIAFFTVTVSIIPAGIQPNFYQEVFSNAIKPKDTQVYQEQDRHKTDLDEIESTKKNAESSANQLKEKTILYEGYVESSANEQQGSIVGGQVLKDRVAADNVLDNNSGNNNSQTPSEGHKANSFTRAKQSMGNSFHADSELSSNVDLKKEYQKQVSQQEDNSKKDSNIDETPGKQMETDITKEETTSDSALLNDALSGETKDHAQDIEESSFAVLDKSKTNTGIISIKYNYAGANRLKVLIEKDGTRYTYDLKGDNTFQKFPLQMGSGCYLIGVLENLEGNKYKYITKENIDVSIADPMDTYLKSVQMINWNESMAPIIKAKALVSGTSDDMEKVRRIYNYMVANIQYDNSKAGSLSKTYLPNIETIYAVKKGICYDFASMFAAMLRSIDVPAKLVKGYAEGVEGYHAWNEVYIKSKKGWLLIDTSFDAQMKAKGCKVSMVKKKSIYKKVKEY